MSQEVDRIPRLSLNDAQAPQQNSAYRLLRTHRNVENSSNLCYLAYKIGCEPTKRPMTSMYVAQRFKMLQKPRHLSTGRNACSVKTAGLALRVLAT